MIFLDANFIIYLNLGVKEVENFYIKVLQEDRLALDPLVIDEVIYISKKKYNVNFNDTISFLDEIVLPNSLILPIRKEDYDKAKEIMLQYNLKPSDAFHVAVMLNNSISKIISEDKDFDRTKEIHRVWIT
ncbi:PilT protein domain protein [Sulfolobus islandicus Y.G.57.14]|jgi:predicted nucleic acid-binding protein|uniref:PilT protein domain protein n=3 Tax=Saccharolobus islandicus TaxID=43080 RepID=C3NB49_SACI7|nr:type II toxin-antitoxin system VapC family toxin [Sulfolobus islandicus]ACP46865.1 PilT protein domain protein [Sulfolobus islandicus Y.G.57.14]ACP47457.1 PilT protein domain protein [Sulfolobus islandicus Y.N.15.51]ADB88399.1 PilT protein domain protein [Sulfolobus islandicus L.D.8.5]